MSEWAAAGNDRAIRFTGNWREYLPIAATNALLTICTLGVYRFWAIARERRYLWSRTHVIDDCLEWTGTGKEMFFGFLIVIAILAPFYILFEFLFPALVAHGKTGAAIALIFVLYIALMYLGGFARFRALRYRLSRSYWHGIRGGSDDPGWRYGGESLGRYALAVITMFVMFPWTATRLWSSRWNAMSVGPLAFRADMNCDGLKLRWALIYLVPLGLLLIAGIIAAAVGASITVPADADPVKSQAIVGIIIGMFFVFCLAIPLMTLNWFAAYYRKAAEATKLGNLEFGFDATTLQWLGLFIGNVAIAIVTLGFGLFYMGYRNWSFVIRHTHVYGSIDVSELTQSTTHAPREAEGFADAFDVGAI